MYVIVTSIMVCLFHLLEGFTRFRLLEMSSDLGIVLCDDDDTVNKAMNRRWEHFLSGYCIRICFWVSEMRLLQQLLCHISNREIDGRVPFVQNLVKKYFRC